MPELPDVTVYVEALARRLVGKKIERIRVASPFVLRSVAPPIQEAVGQRVTGVSRIGKRIVLALEGDLFLVIHLMIAGRFQWKEPGAKAAGRITMATFEFENGTLILTEAASKKRASLHLVSGAEALRTHDPGGLEVLDAGTEAFREALLRENRTLKRALTDPRIFSGIGNAYSDEILHRAQLSPVQTTHRLGPEEIERLRGAVRVVLAEWTGRLRDEAAGQFPVKVTAFRPGMAVHGRQGEPCPVCGTAVQRIIYAENECNYCPRCQTGGRLLADRVLSRLLKEDWPRTVDELEAGLAARRDAGGKNSSDLR